MPDEFDEPGIRAQSAVACRWIEKGTLQVRQITIAESVRETTVDEMMASKGEMTRTTVFASQ